MSKINTPDEIEDRAPQGSPPPVYDKPKPAPAMIEQAPTTNVVTLPPIATPPRQVYVAHDDVAMFDTAKFEQMQRVASVLAEWPLTPLTFRARKDENDQWVKLSDKAIFANCFMAVSYAQRWRMDPFALIQHASVINNRIMWEGKVIHAALQSCLGVNLRYDFIDADDMQMGVKVSATLPGETEPRVIQGTVEAWHTGYKGAWAAQADWPRQLRYMGAREWARAFAPAIILGVFAFEEQDTAQRIDEQRGYIAKDVTPSPSVAPDIPDDDVPDIPVDDVPVVQIELPPVEAAPAQGETKTKWATMADPAKTLKELGEDLERCGTREAVAEVADQYDSAIEEMPPAFKTAARKMLKRYE